MLSIIPLSIILGIGTAIYLEEYAKNNKFTQFVKISISNLAGVPSVVFGLLGYTLFVGGAGIEALKMGNSILAAALTMTLLILPIIIVSSQEAIRAVPNSVREASYGLGANVYVSIENGIKSLSIDDRGFARQTVKNDKHINQLNYNINERVIMLITKQQPIASDLRMMISSLKIASDLERIGDNASSIANIRLRTKITDDYVLTRLKTMGKLAMLMLKDLDQAFKKKDTVLIREIIERDEDIDDLYSHIINATYLIDNDPFVAAQAHLAARHLERIGDHIINIAESVYFYLTGTHYEQ
ncbi:TPA: phosphate signaling complex protein PhoU [Staphylococcus aureus]